ncbi:MAG: DnaB-like helicase C-terminal domain-containing protein [Candidatus Theseobacter exili]|nr:DnaB-like helicase C-terminal domain-containing protein [Candidatus Theseobacter exili]
MDIQELKEHIGQEAENIIRQGLHLEKKGTNYHCNNSAAHEHGDKNPSLSWDPERLQFYCFTCKLKIDIYDYYKNYEKREHADIMQQYENKSKSASDLKPTTATKKSAPLKEYTKIITELYQKQKPADKKYFIDRGITDKIIEKYKLCTGNIQPGSGKRAFIPIWKDGKVVAYSGRALEQQEPKYKNTAGTIPLFNSDILKTCKDEDVIFITEGAIDCMTLEAGGYKSVSILGAANTNKFKNAVEGLTAKPFFITAFDNDATGATAAAELECARLNIPTIYHDINEWYMGVLKDLKTGRFREDIDKQIYNIKNPDTATSYMQKQFMNDIAEFTKFESVKTGFTKLDKELTLYPGLYVLGGAPSSGKSTWAHQLCDQFAEKGHHCIFYSLEQSRLELVTKSLARLTAQRKSPASAFSIRRGKLTDTVQEAIDTYSKKSDRITMIEANFDIGTDRIREYVKEYIQRNTINPIVFLDYLQIIPGDDLKLGDKQRIDFIATELKRISRELKIMVFVISSLNRTSYLSPIDFVSFKESGGIEFTADVLLGLQLDVINNDFFDNDKKIIQKRKKIKAAKEEDPRKMELICLKNRNGKSSFSCRYLYYASRDLFVEDEVGTGLPF